MSAPIETATDPALAGPRATPIDHRLSSEDGKLRVAFTWQTDRYAHVIDARGDGQLLSLEGTPADDWPASAAISQLSTEVIDGRATILGVGCSGTTHFSVSVQLDEATRGKPAIHFDWAARLAKPLGASETALKSDQDNLIDKSLAWLGSTYSQPSSDHGKWGIETAASTRLDHQIDEKEQRLTLQPTQMNEVRTVVWSYRVSMD